MQDALRIVITGDICPNMDLDRELTGPDGHRFLAAAAPLFKRADLVIGNLETPLCRQTAAIAKTGPNFICDPAVASALKRDGFDGFTLANNHILDQDRQGLAATLRTLDETALPHCGAGMTHEDACRPAFFQVRDRRVGVFNFAEGEFAQAQDDGAGTARLDPFWSEQRIQKARTQFDVILVILHIGNEHQPIPSGVTADWCRRMIAAGADAVVAHHAHIPQGTFRYRQKPIAFSLGNFLFGYPFDPTDTSPHKREPFWHLSTVAELRITPAGSVTLNLHPFKQNSDRTLSRLSASGRKAFDVYIKACNAIMKSPEQHRRFWEQEARNLFKNHRHNLPALVADLNGNDPEKEHRAATVLFNLFRCEAHHETMRRGLQLMYEKRFADDIATQSELDRLTALLHDCF